VRRAFEVIAPQTWMLAASISALVKPRWAAGRSRVVQLLVGNRACLAEILAQRPLVEDELDVEGAPEPARSFDLSSVKPLAFSVDGLMPAPGQRAVADGIGVDLGDLASE
jgi:hypothetical protein